MVPVYTLQEVYDTFGPGGQGLKWYEGQMAVNDWNNDGKIDDEDKQIFGCTDPKWTGSLSFYPDIIKGFDFSFDALYETRAMVTQLFPRTIHELW